MLALQNPTEQVGSNGNTAHFYSRDTWFKTKLGHQLFKFVLWISLVCCKQIPGQYLKLHHSQFLPHNIQFKPCHGSCGQLPVSYHGGPGSFLDQPMQDLWWKTGWNRLFSRYYNLATQYHSTNAPHLFIHLPLTLYILAIESIIKFLSHENENLPNLAITH